MGIELRAGDVVVRLAPEVGGAIAAFTWRGHAVLRPVADARLRAQGGRAVAAYPLVPYANRIDRGRFLWGGERFQLARNFGDSPHSIHGNGWMSRWDVVAAGAGFAQLRLDYAPQGPLAGTWPFAYRAEQWLALDAEGLSIGLRLENRDDRAWPAGLGMHPYLARTPRATLRFEADTLWTTGEDGMPRDREAVHGAVEFDHARPLGPGLIDCCYAGWGGNAVLSQPEHDMRVRLSAPPPMDHLQLYTPPGCDYIGLEPVTNMPDAINRMERVSDQGLVVLAPGEVLSASLRIAVTTLDDAQRA